MADSVGALEALCREGKIAAIGLSNVTIAELDMALVVAPIATVQNHLSLGDPSDLVPSRACDATLPERPEERGNANTTRQPCLQPYACQVRVPGRQWFPAGGD